MSLKNNETEISCSVRDRCLDPVGDGRLVERDDRTVHAEVRKMCFRIPAQVSFLYESVKGLLSEMLVRGLYPYSKLDRVRVGSKIGLNFLKLRTDSFSLK